MIHLGPRRLIQIFVLLALLLGCTTDGPPSDTENSPLAAVLLPSEDFDEQVHTDLERLVQECMASEGFTYAPNEFTEPTDFTLLEVDGQWEYGVTRAMTDPGPAPATADANQDKLRDLPESERIAWLQTLNNSDSGCRSLANQRLQTQYGVANFGRELSDLAERIATNPERIALDSEWTNCMARHGYNFDSRDAATTHLVQQVTVQSALGAIDQQATDLTSTESRPLAGEAALSLSHAQLSALDALETQIATADANCSQTLNYQARLAELETILKQEFLNDMGQN